MKKIVALLVVVVFLAVACGQEESTNPRSDSDSLEKQEGLIVEIRTTEEDWRQILVVPDISEEDIANKKEEELMKIAQEKNGAYYGFEKDEYKELEVGMYVIVSWDGLQLDSDPPQRGIEKLEVISEE